MVQSKQGTKYP